MSEPIEIDPDYLFAKIGRLVVENELLRAKLDSTQDPQPPRDED